MSVFVQRHGTVILTAELRFHLGVRNIHLMQLRTTYSLSNTIMTARFANFLFLSTDAPKARKREESSTFEKLDRPNVGYI